MELKKTNENINRSFNEDGQSQDRVDSVNYNVLDSEGNLIGSAHVNSGHAHFEFNLYNFATVEEGEVKLREVLGIEDPNP